MSQEIKRIAGVIPDRETSFGRAWRIDPEAIAKKLRVSKHHTVATWVVEAVWAHPWWCNYALAAIHLRPSPGIPPAKIMLEGATHEVFLYALDPDHVPDLEDPLSSRLQPGNFMGQWIAANDIDAEAKIERCVEEILAGELSPDTDFRRQWIQRFSDSNINK